MGVEIRKAVVSDLDNIVGLYKEYRPDWTPNLQLPSQIKSYPTVVVLKENEIIAFAYCFNFAPDILEVANIYVTKKERGAGLGRKILENIEYQMKENTKYKGLILSNSSLYKAVQEKYSASNFYLENGYREIAETEFTKIFYKTIDC